MTVKQPKISVAELKELLWQHEDNLHAMVQSIVLAPPGERAVIEDEAVLTAAAVVVVDGGAKVVDDVGGGDGGTQGTQNGERAFVVDEGMVPEVSGADEKHTVGITRNLDLSVLSEPYPHGSSQRTAARYSRTCAQSRIAAR
jgi:hypothetical protein